MCMWSWEALKQEYTRWPQEVTDNLRIYGGEFGVDRGLDFSSESLTLKQTKRKYIEKCKKCGLEEYELGMT